MFSVLMEMPVFMGDVAAGLLGAWQSVWPYLVMLLGFSAIVFVHELGHFMVAKWADVRVERFAIGFGKELFGFTKGETRYSFNVLPLGGYVKMLGQEDFDDKSNELKFKADPRSFVNKPVGWRMAVVSAGVVMNIIFACLLFMIVFLIGMKSEAPRIAYIEPDSPAEQSGLLPGDKVLEINGERIRDFKEITSAILLAAPHEPITFTIERNDEPVRPILVKPDYRHPENTRDLQRQIIGIGPGKSREIVDVGPDVDPSKPDSPKVGDVLVEIAGTPVTDENVSRISEMLAYTDGPVFVERKSPNSDAPPQRVQVRIPPRLGIYPSDPRDAGSTSILGLAPLVRFAYVDPDGRAGLAGIEAGDTVLQWDDRDFPGSSFIAESVRDNPEKDVPFRVLKVNGREVPGIVRPKRNRNGPATVQAICKQIDGVESSATGPKVRFSSVRPRGIAAKAGIDVGDVIIRCGDVENPTSAEVNRMIRQGKGRDLAIMVRKADGRTVATTLTPQAPGSIDAGHGLIADGVLRVGDIVEKINGVQSPAAESGIPGGALITSVNGKQVTSWRELISAFRTAAGSTADLGFVASGGPATVKFRVPHCLRTMLGVGPEARIVRIDGRELVNVNLNGIEEQLSIRYHEGTRRVLKELVGREQVPIEFRPDCLSPAETKWVDVTEDMVDPWLARVAMAPSASLGSELIIVKGENALDAVVIGLHKTWAFIVQVYQVMHRMIFSRSVSVETMSGPLGILDIGGKIAQSGTVQFLFFLAIISANLAVINFLPLPIVDGGLMVFLIIEKIKGSPVSLRVQIATQMIGIFLIIGCFIFVTYQDALRLWG